MASFFRRKNREPSISSMGSSETRGSTDTHKHRDRALPNYFGEDAPERAGSAFRNRLKDMKSRWSDIMNVDDLLQAELADARLHPEIQWAASLRRSNDLCDAEAALVKARRKKAVKQLKRFLKLPDDEEVDERDIPIVCLGGSGGGFRAVS
ncbi:hypothetical protein BDY24DRAFT_157163 [Mrakia frigida]|uniref:uncharacterized protein n=1 Tax=Mrakia frigida TaxID=29902 RepID=UPI003FCC0043